MLLEVGFESLMLSPAYSLMLPDQGVRSQIPDLGDMPAVCCHDMPTTVDFDPPKP